MWRLNVSTLFNRILIAIRIRFSLFILRLLVLKDTQRNFWHLELDFSTNMHPRLWINGESLIAPYSQQGSLRFDDAAMSLTSLADLLNQVLFVDNINYWMMRLVLSLHRAQSIGHTASAAFDHCRGRRGLSYKLPRRLCWCQISRSLLKKAFFGSEK